MSENRWAIDLTQSEPKEPHRQLQTIPLGEIFEGMIQKEWGLYLRVHQLDSYVLNLQTMTLMKVMHFERTVVFNYKKVGHLQATMLTP